MKKLILPLVFMTVPLSAQSFELGAFIGSQSYKKLNTTYISPGLVSENSVDNKNIFGFRIGYSPIEFGSVMLQITASYRPETTATLHGVTSLPNLSQPSVFTQDYKTSHWSAGGMLTYRGPVAFGVGVEYRFEKLTRIPVPYEYSYSYNRPWARVNISYSFPNSSVKPFIGIEADAPLTSVTFSGPTDSTESLVKSTAPKGEFGIYAGLRF